MSNKKTIEVEKQIGTYQQGSGSKYHKEHASNVPDYGANSVDPNVRGFTDNSNKESQ